MKVLFLDVDGVLNSYRTVEVYGSYKVFDPVAVKMMQKLHKMGVKFVLSSAWRLYQTNLAAKNLGFDFYGVTPNLDGFRGDEVQWWLNASREDGVTHYCCVDDGSDFYCFQNLVKTTFEEGFTRKHLLQVLDKLDLKFDDYFDAKFEG